MARADWEIWADATVSQGGNYVGIAGRQVDRTAHLTTGQRPAGGNMAFLDGHTEWRKFQNMINRFGNPQFEF